MSSYSRTAEYMALFRALETAQSVHRRLFADPFARHFLRAPLRAVVQAARMPAVNSAACRYIDQRWPGARSAGVARTRYIDDQATQAFSDETQQAVILGAGFDSRAYRLPKMKSLRVFEVDHPNTSGLKQRRVEKVVGHAPDHVCFVVIDFTKENLSTVLDKAGFDLAQKTFFLWEGVTNYLNASSVDAVLRYVATSAIGSRVVFTYIDKDVLRPDTSYGTAASARRLVHDKGEPWTFGLDPLELEAYLKACGLKLLSDLGAKEYRSKYWSADAGGMIGYEFYRVAVAEVT